ncbi:MAG: 1,4-alpha-glucan branching enzyme, partial [Microbacteriaceae bacterium]
MSPIPEGAAGVILPELPDELLAALADGRYHDPHAVLGQHVVAAEGIRDPVTVIRVLRPLADAVSAVTNTGARISLGHIGHGIWQGLSLLGPDDYLVETRYPHAPVWTADDPYRYAPSIGDLDLHLIREGRHERLWDVVGAHHRANAGAAGTISGTSFTVWAPNARAVRVIGDFNDWDGTRHSMRTMGASGIWELFLPGV